MPKPTMFALGFALLWGAPLAVAQSNLGELLDAGAKKLSANEFKEELVQRVLVGPTANGGRIELMYASSGAIAGIGTTVNSTIASIVGEWTVDESGRICSRMQIGTTAFGQMMLPYRCQFWFKRDEQYFLSDSDSDRHIRVLSRTLKQ